MQYEPVEAMTFATPLGVRAPASGIGVLRNAAPKDRDLDGRNKSARIQAVTNRRTTPFALIAEKNGAVDCAGARR